MPDKKDNLGYQREKIRSLREKMGVNRTEFSKLNGIPLRTVEDWEAGRRKMPDYVLRLLTYKIEILQNKICASKNVNIIRDECGKSIVIINDVRFKSRRNINWDKVEEYLKEYIGRYYEIAETSEKIYIGTDFPDEFCHSTDKIKLKGANEKAKANLTSAIGELIQIADNKTESEDFDKKHKSKAKLGWYRYDTRFGIPVYENDELKRYNIFSARMLVRCDADGKMYLYDFVRTKKETSSPHEQK
ncbi:MAG: helix-turn-helix domain-containing protein [Lachnospiraceae bacterium]